jgi:hypothetical protein
MELFFWFMWFSGLLIHVPPTLLMYWHLQIAYVNTQTSVLSNYQSCKHGSYCPHFVDPEHQSIKKMKLAHDHTSTLGCKSRFS